MSLLTDVISGNDITVALDEKSIQNLAIALVVVIAIALALWVMAKHLVK